MLVTRRSVVFEHVASRLAPGETLRLYVDPDRCPIIPGDAAATVAQDLLGFHAHRAHQLGRRGDFRPDGLRHCFRCARNKLKTGGGELRLRRG